MYLIRNLTSRTIILSDIRAEIGPYKILDLERVIARRDIEGSANLRDALTSKQLQFVKQTVVQLPGSHSDVVEKTETRVIERTIEKHSLDEKRLKQLIREAVKDMGHKSPDTDIEKSVSNALTNSLGPLLESLRKMGGLPEESIPGDVIDPKQLAELQQRAIERMSENIDSDSIKTRKKIRITNTQNLNDLANEL